VRPEYHPNVQRARRHQRLFSGLAFALLALVAELAGRSLTHRFDVGRHVGAHGYATANYYPFLVGGVKIAIALLLARLAWRFARAHTAARAARRLLAAAGREPARAPGIRVQLSARLWLAAFVATSLFYLVQTDAERLSTGNAELLAPWLHTSALPIFAVLAVLIALVWGVVARWLADYERFAEAAVAFAQRTTAGVLPPPSRRTADARTTPRRLFGLAFESRPPPVPA
jgi:hypothetical protein